MNFHNPVYFPMPLKWLQREVIDDIFGNLIGQGISKIFQPVQRLFKRKIGGQLHRQEAVTMVFKMDECEEKRFIIKSIRSLRNDNRERYSEFEMGLAHLWQALEDGLVNVDEGPQKVTKKDGETTEEYGTVDKEEVIDFYKDTVKEIARVAMEQDNESDQQEEFYSWIESFREDEMTGFIAVIAEQSQGFLDKLPDRLRSIRDYARGTSEKARPQVKRLAEHLLQGLETTTQEADQAADKIERRVDEIIAQSTR